MLKTVGMLKVDLTIYYRNNNKYKNFCPISNKKNNCCSKKFEFEIQVHKNDTIRQDMEVLFALIYICVHNIYIFFQSHQEF